MPSKTRNKQRMETNVVENLLETLSERMLDRVCQVLADRLGPLVNRLEQNVRYSTVREKGAIPPYTLESLKAEKEPAPAGAKTD